MELWWRIERFVDWTAKTPEELLMFRWAAERTNIPLHAKLSMAAWHRLQRPQRQRQRQRQNIYIYTHIYMGDKPIYFVYNICI